MIDMYMTRTDVEQISVYNPYFYMWVQPLGWLVSNPVIVPLSITLEVEWWSVVGRCPPLYLN